MLLALNLSTWSFSDIAVAIVIIAALVAIVWVALKTFGVAIPGWAIQILWIVLVCIVAILAIRFVASL